MSLIASGTWNGTGAKCFIGCGFIPDEVHVNAVGDSALGEIVWSVGCRTAASIDGFQLTPGSAVTLYTAGTGIQRYELQELLDSTLQTGTGYGEGVYLKFDPLGGDYSKNTAYGGDGGAITDWTLTDTATRAGKFNRDIVASGNRIGQGSIIAIQEDVNRGRIRHVTIETLTAGTGIADDEVTLSEAVPDGKILSISGRYDMIPTPLKEVQPQGFICNVTSGANENDEIQHFTAIQYDN